MSLNEFLHHKREAVLARDARIAAGDAGPAELHAHVRAEGRSGLRRLRMRDHQVISDSAPGFAGFDLGPSSPELQLGVLGSCMVHIFEIHAARLQVPIDTLEVDVRARMDPRAGHPGYDDVPHGLQGIHYQLRVGSPATDEQLRQLYEVVEQSCPILGLLRDPQDVRGEMVRA